MNDGWMPVSMRLGNKPIFEISEWIPDEVKPSIISIISELVYRNRIDLDIFNCPTPCSQLSAFEYRRSVLCIYERFSGEFC